MELKLKKMESRVTKLEEERLQREQALVMVKYLKDKSDELALMFKGIQKDVNVHIQQTVD